MHPARRRRRSVGRAPGEQHLHETLNALARAPSTVARLVIHFGPESYCQGSGSSVLEGGSRECAVAFPGMHAPAKKPPPVSGMQAYIACPIGR